MIGDLSSQNSQWLLVGSNKPRDALSTACFSPESVLPALSRRISDLAKRAGKGRISLLLGFPPTLGEMLTLMNLRSELESRYEFEVAKMVQ